jgi:hypothetical protein
MRVIPRIGRGGFSLGKSGEDAEALRLRKALVVVARG